eukprot:gene4431-biopygen8412
MSKIRIRIPRVSACALCMYPYMCMVHRGAAQPSAALRGISRHGATLHCTAPRRAALRRAAPRTGSIPK